MSTCEPQRETKDQYPKSHEKYVFTSFDPDDISPLLNADGENTQNKH